MSAAARLEEFLSNPDTTVQQPVQELTRRLVGAAMRQGFIGIEFARALGGMMLYFRGEDWEYGLGLTTGAPNIGRSTGLTMVPWELITVLRAEEPNLFTNSPTIEGLRSRSLERSVLDELVEDMIGIIHDIQWADSRCATYAVIQGESVGLQVDDRLYGQSEVHVNADGVQVFNDNARIRLFDMLEAAGWNPQKS